MAAFMGNVGRIGRNVIFKNPYFINTTSLGSSPLLRGSLIRALRPCECSSISMSQGLMTRFPSYENRSKLFSTSPAVQKTEEEDSSTDIVQKVNSQLTESDLGRLFAIVHVNNYQRKITVEDILVVDLYYEADIGERIRLNKVMMVGGSDFTLVGRPVLSPELVHVEAVVLEKTIEYSKVWFAYKRRKSWKRMKVKRKPQTFLRITNIEVSSLKDS